MVDRARAIAFVNRHATPVERACLRYLLRGEVPALSVIDALFAGQHADGGWASFWAPAHSSLDATCFRLAQADQLGVTGAKPVRAGALPFMLERQRDDGSWEEDEELGEIAPPWAKPGDPAARLYLTANCGYWLAVLTGDILAVAQAAIFLAHYLEADDKLPTFAHAHWLAGGLWYRVGQREPAERVMRHLQTVLLPDLAASNLGWLLTALLTVGVPKEHALLAQAAERLGRQQQADGRWVSEDGPDHDVHATLEALRALTLYDQR